MFKTAIPFAAALWLAATPAQAQQFSAGLVRTETGALARNAGRINVSNGRVRLETPDVAGGYFVIDGAAHTAHFVRPAERVFMEARQSSALTRLLAPLDPAAPCPQWQALAEDAGAAERGAEWRCERLGNETINGRETIRHQAFPPGERSYSGWIDPQLRFPVRVQTGGGAVVDVVNIHEAPQPDSLFEIPAGYRKFDPLQLIERIKRSDVWVEPPP